MGVKGIVPAGRVLILTTGRYLDYEIVALCRTLTNLDVAVLEKEYKEYIKPLGDPGYVPHRKCNFGMWLLVIHKDLVEELPMAKLHWRDNYDLGLQLTLEGDANRD